MSNLLSTTISEVMPGLWVTKEGLVLKEASVSYRGYNKHNRGYPCIAFDGKRLDVHRLVAKAFIPNPEDKPCVCHKDDNTYNTHADNLFWGTYKENMQDMVAKGRSNKGKRGRPQKWQHLEAILAKRNQGLSQRNIGIALGITEGRVSQILKAYSKTKMKLPERAES